MANGNNENRILAWIIGAFVLGVLLLAAAALKASWTLGPQLVSSGMLIVFKVLIFIGGAGGLIAVGLVVPLVAYQRLTRLLQDNRHIAKELTRRSPTIAAVALLLSEFAISAFETGAEENKAAALAFKGFAALCFWLANDLFLKTRRLRLLGIALWLGTVAFLVVGTAIANHWTFRELLTHVTSLQSNAALSLGVVVVILAVFPFVVAKRNPELFNE